MADRRPTSKAVPTPTPVAAASAVPTGPRAIRIPGLDPDRMPKWIPRAIALGVLAVLATDAFRWLFERLSNIVVMVIVSMFLSFALEPTVNRLSRKGMKRGLATGLVFLGLVLFTIFFFAAVGKLVVDQVVDVVDNSPTYVAELQDYAHRTLNWDVDLERLQEQLSAEDSPARQWASGMAGNAVGIGSSAVGAVFSGFTVLMFSFYLVAEGPKARRTVCARLSPARQERVLQTWEIAIDKTGGYLSSRALLMVFSASFASIVFTLLDLPSAIAIALLFAVIAQVIPVIGTYVGGTLAVLVAVANDPVSAIWVVAYIIVYQQIESYLIAPRVTSRTMSLHPAVGLGSVIAGASLLGVIGTILALPAAAVIQAVVSSYLQTYDVIESEMTMDVEVEGDDEAEEQAEEQAEDQIEAELARHQAQAEQLEAEPGDP